MNARKLVLRGLVHYRRNHLRVAAGAMIATAILVGALVVGDSVRHSLKVLVSERLGRTEFALATGDKLFRAAVSDSMTEALGTGTAPLIQVKGIASARGGERRVNSVEVVGADARFGAIGGGKDLYGGLRAGEAVVNRELAAGLEVSAGDEILVRIRKPEAMPGDAPLAPDSGAAIARRYRVAAVADAAAFGKYNLRPDQITPETVVVPLAPLGRDLGFEGRANVLLVAERPGRPLAAADVEAAFRGVWTPADAGLEIRNLPGRRAAELRTERIFLDPPAAEAATAGGTGGRPVLTYFVNEIRRGDMATPYSFVSAPGPPIVPDGMGNDEIVINSWLAGDLGARPGDRITLSYFVLSKGRELEEKRSDFTVRGVVPLEGIYADRELLPDFPGLSDQENCRDWDPGVPIDLDRIRDKDERYWDDHRGTPKAFLSLAAAQSMWANRFGSLTAVRFDGREREDVERTLAAALDPAALGFVFSDVRKEGLAASSRSVSFSQLFLGLSAFLIAAALLLTALLFVFNTEGRTGETGLLLALGFPGRTVRRLLLGEGAVLVTAGAVLGGAAGILYDVLVLAALKTVWKEAVGTSALGIHVTLRSVLMGIGAGILAALLSIWVVILRQRRLPVTALQRNVAAADSIWRTKPRASLVTAVSGLLAAGAILVLAGFGKGENAFAYFFAAGSLLLVSGMAFADVVLFRLGGRTGTGRPGLFSIGVRNGARKRTRSIALVGLLACGLFIVFTVGANRIGTVADPEDRGSGTGGFALYGESAVPVLHDLNGARGREALGLGRPPLTDARIVQFRVREGDDASCLNLNRVANPGIIAVDPAELSRRKAFSFAAVTDGVDPRDPWAALSGTLSDGSVPGVADKSVIVWGLGKSVGDALTYTDERGESFRITLVGGLADSVFQGHVIVSEEAFLERFPSSSGYRLFLVDAPSQALEDTAQALSRAMADYGLDLAPAAARLAAFNAVQNTYLSIFLILGGLGILLGCAGLGIVVSRNVRERRSELALLRALGFSGRAVRSVVLSEHLALVAGGVLLGVLAALLATFPSLLTPGGGIPYPTILIILIVVGLNGTFWTYVAAAAAAGEDLLPALRKE